MAEKKDKTQPNEGEGNRTAAREYNQAQQDFARSGKVQEKAKEARKAVEGVEADELSGAELIGKRHAAEEDPEVKRQQPQSSPDEMPLPLCARSDEGRATACATILAPFGFAAISVICAGSANLSQIAGKTGAI